MIEILEFKLVEGADEAAFIVADKRVQAEFAYQQPGLVRRTTARGSDGTWLVIDLWRSPEDADEADGRWGDHPAAKVFMSLVDRSTMRSKRFSEREE
ncbi:MAG TPA: hypothetical protein VGR90_10880 [Acidimicrobiales bacterium]|nr:hypothetical protein [Acidimicrobiales bacterium]